MATTYEKIATTTLGSAASSITLGSIPSTYTDLRLVVSYFSISTQTWMNVRYNSDSGSNYSVTFMRGAAGSTYSGQQTSQSSLSPLGYYGATSTIPAFDTIDIFSYAGSTYKTCLWTEACQLSGGGQIYSTVGLWRSTSAITSINILAQVDNFATGTTATLYGIKAA
jgi:hypothetical protein